MTAAGRLSLVLVAAAALSGAGVAQESQRGDSRPAAESRAGRRSAFIEVVVDGVEREALVFMPQGGNERPAPLVFGFHGHGGGARQASRSFRVHEEWPSAIVAYPQGLNTPSRRVDPDGLRAGWQQYKSHMGDRDLLFFDALLARLTATCRIDSDRVYAMGHSNGASFTYILWAQRPAVFAAFGPSAGGSGRVSTLPPKPALHVAGRNDTVVPFAGQQRTMLAVRAVNGCTLAGEPWAPGCTLFPSTKGAPFVECIHDGDHGYSRDATAAIVRFFAGNVRPAAAESRTAASREVGGR